MSINRQINKEDIFIHTTGYYSAIERNEILPLVATRVGLEGIMLSEMSDRKGQIQIGCDITYL